MNPLSFEDLKALAQTFVNQLLTDNFPEATSQFDEQMKNVFNEAKLQESWQSLVKKAGKPLELTVLRTAELEGYRIVVIRCQFEEATLDTQVVFNHQGQISGLNFMPVQTTYHPPDYVNQSSFHEVNVTVGSGKWALPGTLTIPNSSGPFPGLVLVHGSGPNDRDETVGSTKVFRDLAWGLASKGIAVLRYEKRTLKHAPELTPELVLEMTVKEEVVDDALLAIGRMRQKADIDSKRVFVLGHSLGATLIPRIGQQDPDLAGLIVMAGITRPLEDTILDQFTYLYSLAGTMTDEQKAQLEDLKVKVARVKDPELSVDVSPKDLPLGVSAAYWLDLRSYSPVDVMKTLSIPALILQGGRDYQVLPTEDFEGWKTALSSRKDVYFKLYPKLNHLFMVGEGKSTPHEYLIEGHVDQEVIDTIAQWIGKIT